MSTKVRKTTSSNTGKHRVATELLLDLLEIERRIRPDQRQPGKPVTVSWADCQRLSHLLLAIARDQDPREYYWRSVNHRPRQVTGKEWQAAFLYLAAIETKEGRSGKVLRGKIATLTGLTDAQVDHAVRANSDVRDSAGKFLETVKADGSLSKFVRIYTELAQQSEK